MAKKIGITIKFTTEIGDEICDTLATTNLSLRTICKKEGMPSVTTILKELANNTTFALQYARAREAQADFLAEEILEIADDSSNDTIIVRKGNQSFEQENKEWTNRSKLRVDSRKWIASKLKPKKYGDKLELDAKIENTTKTVFKLPGGSIIEL